MAYVHQRDIDVAYGFCNEQMLHPWVSCRYRLRYLDSRRYIWPSLKLHLDQEVSFRYLLRSHDWTVSGIFEPGRSDKRLVFVFLCSALIMDIFRKYNMRVWCLFRVCIGRGVPSMLATAENSPLINLTGLSTVSTNHAQDRFTNKQNLDTERLVNG